MVSLSEDSAKLRQSLEMESKARKVRILRLGRAEPGSNKRSSPQLPQTSHCDAYDRLVWGRKTALERLVATDVKLSKSIAVAIALFEANSQEAFGMIQRAVSQCGT